MPECSTTGCSRQATWEIEVRLAGARLHTNFQQNKDCNTTTFFSSFASR
jgi:hypothetical protein